MEKRPFLVTTAIDYPSAKPHMGHAYEKICADVMARFRRLQGYDVWFSTGTDEHGSKIEEAAKKAGKPPGEFVVEMSRLFLELCDLYNISYDDFIRTTEKRHEKVVMDFLERVRKKNLIYKGMYEGNYCVECETFFTEKDLDKGKCPVHGKPTTWVKEESYFFRMSEFQKRLVEHIRKNPEFIRPASKRNELLNRLKEPLKDLSISRKSVAWGLPLPFDREHTNYVWFDALINYITTVGGLDSKKYMEFWPTAFHNIGVDIVWHHTVIWGSMLLALDIPLPRVFSHGFVLNEGVKMSKSLGNVVDPVGITKRYPVDTIRYFLIREIPFGEDGSFSDEAMKARINGELVADLGNLASRVLTLAEKHGGPFRGKPELDKELDLRAIEDRFEKLELHHTLDGVWSFVRACNKYINDKEPWKLEGEELTNALYNLLEGLRVISILIKPFMPETSDKIAKQLGVRAGTFRDCGFGEFRGKPKKGEHLFSRIE